LPGQKQLQNAKLAMGCFKKGQQKSCLNSKPKTPKLLMEKKQNTRLDLQ